MASALPSQTKTIARPLRQARGSGAPLRSCTVYSRPYSRETSNHFVLHPSPLDIKARRITLSHLHKTMPVARFRCICNAGRSDITSELELQKPQKEPERRVNGVFWIILLNLGIYIADHLLKLPFIKNLYLYHGRPDWFQFVTATFCHSNWEHLSGNLFFLYIFGKLVEEEEGNLGLWISYLVTGVGANLVSWLVLPRSAVSVGASGAVFGLFAVSVLVKMSWDWRKILEVLILGQFVIEKVLDAAQKSTGLVTSLGRGSSMGYINHIAHLSGALIGAALIYLVSRVPSQSSAEDATSKKKR